MPTTQILTNSKYQKLLKDLKQLIEGGRKRAQQAASRELIETYWLLGKRIAAAALPEEAGYIQSIVEDLAEDLNTDVSVLRRALYFFEAYPGHAPQGMKLTWSHYRELLTLSDPIERKWYAQQTEQESWTRNELIRAIHEERHNTGKGETKTSNTKLTRPTRPSYVYKARVEKMVDGDTLRLSIDLGFQVWKEQRVRLAKIDAEPLETRNMDTPLLSSCGMNLLTHKLS